MTTDILPPMLWAAVGIASFLAVRAFDRLLAKRRRRNAKPWRKSKTPPKLPVAHQQKTKASMTKAPARKTRARIGVHHKTNR